MTLSDLIKALETAEGPSRELDVEIFQFLLPITDSFALVGPHGSLALLPQKWGRFGLCVSDGWHLNKAPKVTASIDAAMALAWKLWPQCTFELQVWPHQAIADMALNRTDDDLAVAEGDGKNTALAICLAVLRAKLSQDGGGDE